MKKTMYSILLQLGETVNLEGTEKQIEWAENIRYEAVENFIGYCDHIMSLPNYKGSQKTIEAFVLENAKIKNVIIQIVSEKSAAAIIDKYTKGGYDLHNFVKG